MKGNTGQAPAAGGFGTPALGGFGQPQASSPFGTPAPAPAFGTFGSGTPATPAFGSGAFGAASTPAFGQAASTPAFGSLGARPCLHMHQPYAPSVCRTIESSTSFSVGSMYV